MQDHSSDTTDLSQSAHSHDHKNGHDHNHDKGHSHSGGHSHNHLPKDFNRAFAIGVVLNLGFVVAEAAFGIISNSLALLADAGHNLSDVFGLLLAWGATRLARQPATSRRTYGFRRASILAALLNAGVLLIATAGIVWEAVGRIQKPEPLTSVTVIWVAMIGIAINTATALLFMRGREHDLNIRGAWLHMAADALVSLGVVAAGVLILFTGWLWLDPLMSLMIAAVILWSTWGLGREALDLALDAVPPNIDIQAVEDFLRARHTVQEVHDLHVWAISTTQTALTAHIVRSENHANDEFLRQVTQELKAHYGIEHTTIQIESSPCCGQACEQNDLIGGETVNSDAVS